MYQTHLQAQLRIFQIGIRNQIATENYRLVHKFVSRYYGYQSQDLKDELTAVCFKRFLNAIEKWNPDKGALSTYSYMAMKGACLNYFKRSQSKIQSHEVHLDWDLGYSEPVKDDLLELLSSDRLKEIFRLKLEGYTRAEIAKKMGLGTACVGNCFREGYDQIKLKYSA